jgi:hypothetical protein
LEFSFLPDTVSIRCKTAGINNTTGIDGKLYLINNSGWTEFSCSSDGIQFAKMDDAYDKITVPYGADLSNLENRLQDIKNKLASRRS